MKSCPNRLRAGIVLNVLSQKENRKSSPPSLYVRVCARECACARLVSGFTGHLCLRDCAGVVKHSKSSTQEEEVCNFKSSLILQSILHSILQFYNRCSRHQLRFHLDGVGRNWWRYVALPAVHEVVHGLEQGVDAQARKEDDVRALKSEFLFP